MNKKWTKWSYVMYLFVTCFGLSSCTVKAVGDPNRPITINAHVTVDIKGLKETANGIEDYVSGGSSTTTSPSTKGENK